MSEPSWRELVRLFLPQSAALWSALAATFAAFSSWMIWRTQQRNLMETVRPELILTNWSRQNVGEGGAARDEIRFQIQNVGKGVALNIFLSMRQLEEPVTALKANMENMSVPAIASGESVFASSPITLFWKSIDGDFLVINIPISCSDTRGFRYETRYNLMISKLLPNIKVSDPIAPGVLGNRELAIVTPFRKWSRRKKQKRD